MAGNKAAEGGMFLGALGPALGAPGVVPVVREVFVGQGLGSSLSVHATVWAVRQRGQRQ